MKTGKKKAVALVKSKALPVAPQPKQLPFYAPEFSWETFEGFFCDFLSAHPTITVGDGATSSKVEVVSANLYGRRGDSQHGIDIEATMSNGEKWAFQCKHYKSWGVEKTKEAIADCTYKAARKFLLVTRTVSPEVRDEIKTHPGWVVWDSDDISREFLSLPPDQAARLLYTNFGPEWPKALLGLPGLSPLISAEAKFAPFLTGNRNFHHKLPLIGRKEWLKSLDDFVKNSGARVFLLRGKGGLGKSRLLWEWSKGFSKRHKGWALKFVAEAATDISQAIQATTERTILVFDDAHRFDEARRELAGALVARTDIKLVLSLRPGPVDQVKGELLNAGFDTRQIEKPDELKRLSSEHALRLAEEALGPELAGKYRLQLRNLSRDCPLVAVLAAELIKSGILSSKDLDDTEDFKIRVFDGLLREADPVRQEFGARATNDLLHLLAVLAPVKQDADFLKSAAALLGGGTAPDHVSRLLEALDKAGLLLTTEAGIRITPDLLSDHLTYTACYDKKGKTTTFAERVFKHFTPDEFPRFIQHLAEAEWLALQKNSAADSIVEPVWRWFTQRFEASSFNARHSQIEQWASIAHLQPRRTLELARLAMRLQDAPPDTNPWSFGIWDRAHVLAALPAMLKRVAEHHPSLVGGCLDLLWSLGVDQKPARINDPSHSIPIIGKIAGFERWKSIKVSREVQRWLEARIRVAQWAGNVLKPGWLLAQILPPFFSLSVEEHWRVGNTIHFRHLPIDLDNTAEIRERALSVCRDILAQKSVPLALATLDVLSQAIERARIPNFTVPSNFKKRWLTEQRKALDVIAGAVRDYDEPIVHHRARRILLHQIRGNSDKFQKDCEKVLATIPQTLDLQILRVVLGDYSNEFDYLALAKPNDWQPEAKQAWAQLVHDTAEAMLAAFPDSASLLAHVGGLQVELTQLGSLPNFTELILDLARCHPDRALALATELSTRRAHPLGWAFGLLIGPATVTKLDERLRLCEAAIATGDDQLVKGAINGFNVWKTEAALPDRAWQLLRGVASTASLDVADAILRLIEYANGPVVPAEWQLLADLPEHAGNVHLVSRILYDAATLIDRSSAPLPEIADSLLAKLDRVPALGAYDIERGLAHLAKHYPGKVFLLLWRRRHLRENGASDIEPVPYDFHRVRFNGLMDDPAAAEIIHQLEEKILSESAPSAGDTRLLQICLFQSGGSAEPHLQRWLMLATDAERLERLADFARDSTERRDLQPAKDKALQKIAALMARIDWPVVLQYPNFVRSLIEAARGVNTECHEEVAVTLAHLTSGPSTRDGEPDEEWKVFLKSVDDLAAKYQGDAELGPFYSQIAANAHSWTDEMKRRDAADRDEDEDG